MGNKSELNAGSIDAQWLKEAATTVKRHDSAKDCPN